MVVIARIRTILEGAVAQNDGYSQYKSRFGGSSGSKWS